MASDLAVLLIHTIDVEQQTDDVQTDDAGAPVPDWTVVATGLACAIEPISYEERLDWQQRGVTASHTLYLPAQPPYAALPISSNRCRVVFGKRLDGSPRRLSMVHAEDIAEAGIMWEILLYEAFPGAH